MKKKFLSIVILLIILSGLSGCGCARHRKIGREFIEEHIGVITDALSQNNSNKICNLLDSVSNEERADIERFINSHSAIQRVYVDEGGFEHGRGKENGKSYENIRTLSGLIVTTDDVYMYYVDFTVYNKKDLVVNKLWIVSGTTEAIENKNYDSKYHFPATKYITNYKDTHVIYADYYDSYTANHKLIWGEIIEWDDNSNTLESSSFDKNDLNTLPYNEVISKYGRPGGIYDTGTGYHILFYKTSEQGKYTALFLNDDDTVKEVKYTDEIGYGITGIKKVK